MKKYKHSNNFWKKITKYKLKYKGEPKLDRSKWIIIKSARIWKNYI